MAQSSEDGGKMIGFCNRCLGSGRIMYNGKWIDCPYCSSSDDCDLSHEQEFFICDDLPQKRRLTTKENELMIEFWDKTKLISSQVKEELERLQAEIEMLAWESQLPDHPVTNPVLTATGGKLTDGAKQRIKEFMEERNRGIGHDEILILEAESPDVHFEIHDVGGINFDD